jgi:hypothetical protein
MDARLQVASIAVSSLDAASAHFVDVLGLERIGPVEESQLGFDLRWQRLGANGVGFIDLIEPTSDRSLVAKFIAKRDEGVYLVQLGVPDLAASIEELRGRGARLIGVDDRPVEELTMFWIHPSSAHGALIEIVQTDPESATQPGDA